MMLVTPLALALALALPAPAPALAPLRATTGAARAATRTRLAAQIVSQNDRTDVELKQGIGKFYDESSGLWLETWGEHMHHGYYEVGAKPRPGHREAQVDMVDRVLEWANVDALAAASRDGLDIADIGCGAGGSSRHMARRYGDARVTGITLSPVQQAAATTMSNEAGLGSRVRFKVADAMQTPFEDNSFDVVWSLESGEHMPDKDAFIKEMHRICKPGGRIIVVTWCTKDGELAPKEHKLLRKINKAYYLPEWVSVQRYIDIFQSINGIDDIKREDWTEEIAPFWPAVIRSALRPGRFFALLRAGPRTLRGAVAMIYMMRGFKKGTIKFGLIQGTKKKEE